MDYLAKKVLKELASNEKAPNIDRADESVLIESHRRLIKSIGDFLSEIKKERPDPAKRAAPQIPSLPPQINVPEPTVIVRPQEPDQVLHEKLGDLADVNRDMSRSMETMIQLLSDRGAELQIEVTGRDKTGNIKTFEVKRI